MPAVSPTLSGPEFLFFMFFFFFYEATGDKILYREVTGRRTHLLGNACGQMEGENCDMETDCEAL